MLRPQISLVLRLGPMASIGSRPSFWSARGTQDLSKHNLLLCPILSKHKHLWSNCSLSQARHQVFSHPINKLVTVLYCGLDFEIRTQISRIYLSFLIFNDSFSFSEFQKNNLLCWPKPQSDLLSKWIVLVLLVISLVCSEFKHLKIHPFLFSRGLRDERG